MAETSNRPGWQTEELEDEWIEEEEVENSVDDITFGTRSISLTAPLPSHIRSGSDIELEDRDYESEPPSPSPNSTSNSSHNAGTFLIRQDIPAAPLLPQNAKTPGRKGGMGIIKDFFSPLPLERMFEPPSPPAETRQLPAQSSKPKSLLANVGTHEPAFPLTAPTDFTFAVPRSTLLDPNSAHNGNDYPLAQSTPGVRNHINIISTPQHRSNLIPGAAPMTDPRLRLFQFNYDTFTRDHLSAMVDSIAVGSSSTPSGSVTNTTPGSLRAGLSRVSERPYLGLRVRSSMSQPDHSDLRSTKRVKLSPRSDFEQDNYGEGAGKNAVIARPKVLADNSANHLAPPSKPQLFGKDYVTASESLMQQIKQAPRDFSTISTVASGQDLSHAQHSIEQEQNSSPFAHIRRPSHSRTGSSSSAKSKPKAGLYNANTYKQQAAALMAQIKDDMHSKGEGKRIFSGADSDFSVSQSIDGNLDITEKSLTASSSATARSHHRTSSTKSAKSSNSRQHHPSPRKTSVSHNPSPRKFSAGFSSSPRRLRRQLGVAAATPSLVNTNQPRLEVESPSFHDADPISSHIPPSDRKFSGQSTTTTTSTRSQSPLLATEQRFSAADDMNRFVSSSTASGATGTTATSAQSFVKHSGPPQPQPRAVILRITPQDVPALLADHTGRMVFDKVMMKWVKSTARARTGGPGSDTSRRDSREGTVEGDSEDPFRDIESFREDDSGVNISVDAHLAELGIVVGGELELEEQSQAQESLDLMTRIEEQSEPYDDEEEMELTSFSFDNNAAGGSSGLGIVAVMTGVATDDDDQTTDSDDDIDGQVVETTTSAPDEWFDTDDDEAQFGRTLGISPGKNTSMRVSPGRHRASPARVKASPGKNPNALSPSPRRRHLNHSRNPSYNNGRSSSHSKPIDFIPSPPPHLDHPATLATPHRTTPASPLPAIRSALKSNTQTPVFITHSQSYRNKTPLRTLGHRRSVSFSDGRREGPMKDLLSEESDHDLPLHYGYMSDNIATPGVTMSVRTKRITNMMDALEDTGFGDSSEDDESPSKASGSSAKTEVLQLPSGGNQDDDDDDDDDNDKTATPRRTFSRSKAQRSMNSVAANGTFLTECSFGVAHDRLVQVITDVQPFEPYWEDLGAIDLNGQGLESAARLKEFLPKLDELMLNNNRLSWLSGIPATVRTLSVALNRLTGMTSYSHLLNLENLDISGNEIDSLRQLSCLRHLRELRADSNLIQSIDGLQAMDGLVKLSLQGNAIRTVDLHGYRLHRLEMLNLSENKIDEIIGLAASLPSLVILNIDTNHLGSLTFSVPMQRLRVLRVSSNRLRALDVAALPSLRTLYADNNSLGSLLKVNRLSKLENLSLRNQSGSARNVNVLSGEGRDVKRLYFSGNPLKPGFLADACYNLIYLELAACRISVLPAQLAALVPNLRVLNLNYNFLEDARPLEGLTRLRKLTIIGSRLKGSKALIRIVHRMPDVEMLDFRMNPCTLGWYLPLLVRDVPGALQPSEGRGHGNKKPATVTQGWHELDSKFRRDLPDESYIGRLAYRGLIMRACPRIRILDGIEVSEKEKIKAQHLIQGILGKSKLSLSTQHSSESSNPGS